MKLFLQVFWRCMRTEKSVIVKKIITSVLLAAMWVIEPLYARYAVDTLIQAAEGVPVDFVLIIGVWFGLYFITSIVSGTSMRYVWDMRNTVVARSREMYYEALLKLDVEHHIKARSGEMMKKIDNASETLADLTQQLLIQLPTSTLTSLAFFVFSLFISVKLTLIALATLPVFILIVYTSNKVTRANAQFVNNLWVNALGRGYDAVTNIFTVKSSGREQSELSDLQKKHADGIQKLRQVNTVWALVEGIGFFSLLRITLAAAGIYLYSQGELSLGSVFFYQFGFFRMIVPLEMLGNMSPRWNEMIGRVELAEELYQTPVRVQNIEHPVVIENLKGNIECKNVSLRYDQTDALENINLSIEPGQHIALVGHSGAGKSTMAMLFNRFYDPTSGSITVDGVDLRELDLRWWRKQIGLVLQENVMFNDTIYENILYSRPSATKEEVELAAKRASAHDFITNFPNGYESEIGERGIRLSGGERQRIAIARAMLKEPKIVLLDEATSALDSITEQHVQTSIAELIKGRTAVIIAHRLSTVRNVDKIAVFDTGKLIAFDKHQTLMRTCTVYKEMVELQSEGMLAE